MLIIVFIFFLLTALVILLLLVFHIWNKCDGYVPYTILLSFSCGIIYTANSKYLFSKSNPSPLDVYRGETVMLIEHEINGNDTICDTTIVFKNDEKIAGRKMTNMYLKQQKCKIITIKNDGNTGEN